MRPRSVAEGWFEAGALRALRTTNRGGFPAPEFVGPVPCPGVLLNSRMPNGRMRFLVLHLHLRRDEPAHFLVAAILLPQSGDETLLPFGCQPIQDRIAPSFAGIRVCIHERV